MATFSWIPCRIERGGFTSERIFEINLADGKSLVGTSDIDHLSTSSRTPLDETEPPAGAIIAGFVKCRVLREAEGDAYLVEVPSADVVPVSAHDLATSN